MAHQAAPGHVDDATATEPWREELTREISEDAAGGVASQVSSILLDLLTTFPEHGPEAAREAARRIDADYGDAYLPSDPLLKGADDRGMTMFLERLYGLILSVVTFIDCDDARQDALVQLVAELRKLPPKAFKIMDVSNHHCILYSKGLRVGGTDLGARRIPWSIRETLSSPSPLRIGGMHALVILPLLFLINRLGI